MSFAITALERRFTALGLHVTARLLPDGDRCLVARDNVSRKPVMIRFSRSLTDAANYLYTDCLQKEQARQDSSWVAV